MLCSHNEKKPWSSRAYFNLLIEFELFIFKSFSEILGIDAML